MSLAARGTAASPASLLPALRPSSRRCSAVTFCAAVPEPTSRRVLLSALALVPALQLAPGAGAAEEAARFVDDEQHFSIAVPGAWERAEGVATGAIGTRKVSLWHAPADLETNVNVVSTNASVDIVKLSSLGSAYEFGFHLVVSQDRRSARKNPQVAELLVAEQRGDAYFVEYTIRRPEEGVDRHLYSLVMLRFDGTYNRLWTVTGQHRASDTEKYGALVSQAVASFKLEPLV